MKAENRKMLLIEKSFMKILVFSIDCKAHEMVCKNVDILSFKYLIVFLC